MKDLKKKIKAEESKKAKLCHYCQGREDKGVKSAKKKACNLHHGKFLGRKWYPCH